MEENQDRPKVVWSRDGTRDGIGQGREDTYIKKLAGISDLIQASVFANATQDVVRKRRRHHLYCGPKKEYSVR